MSVATLLVKKAGFKIKKVISHYDTDGSLCCEDIWVSTPAIDKPLKVLYCRVSTQKQVSNTSFVGQINNSTVSDIDLIIVEVVSGYYHRCGFSSLIKLLDTHPYGVHLISSNMHRLTRNKSHFMELMDCVMRNGQRLDAPPFHINPLAPASISSNLTLQIPERRKKVQGLCEA